MLRSRFAFTLLELAVVLVIVSMMTGFGLQLFQSTGSVDCYAQTETKLKDIKRALDTYVAREGRLPKPSLMGLGSSAAAFGKEAVGTQTDPTQANYGANDANGRPVGMSYSGSTLIGALPHSDLGLSVDYAADCWGDKFTYAVTNPLTSKHATSGYPAAAVLGAITLNSNSIASPNQMSNQIDYVVISHGMNKYGATPMSANDRTAADCNGASGSMIDRENCDTTNTNFWNSTRNIGTGAADYFDDIVIFGKKGNLPPPSDCTAQTVAWGSCSAAVGAILHGATAPATNTASGYTGTADVTCTNGVLSTSNTVCNVIVNCTDQTLNWGSGCSVQSGSQLNGASATLANSAAGRTGSVNFTCNAGSYTINSSSCNLNCLSGGVSWSSCAGTAGAATHGAPAAVVSNTNSGYSGSVTVTCSNGAFSQSSPTCTPTAANCSAQVVSWGSCSANTGGTITHGNSAPVSNSAPGYTGSATASCNNGTATASGTCNANCTTRPESWGAGCSGTTPAITHGNTALVTNTNPAYTGDVTMSCTNGTLSQTGIVSCDPASGCATGQSVNAMDCSVESDASPTCCTSPQQVIYRDHSQNVGSCGLMNWTSVQCDSCKADGQPTWGHASNCCNGDSDSDGICGTAGSCDDQGYCDNFSCSVSCQGANGSCPNNFGAPIAPSFGSGCDNSLCPRPCHADGQPVTCGDNSSCCNGDSDGNGTCGTQGPVVPVSGLAAGDGTCLINSPAISAGVNFTATYGPVNGISGPFAGGSWTYAIGPVSWQDMGTYWSTGDYADNADVICHTAPCPSAIEVTDSCINNSSGGTWTTDVRKSDGFVTRTHHN